MHHRSACSSVVGALIIIAVGVMLLLNNNGILRFADIWRLWPLVFVIGGAVRLTQSGPNAKVVGGLMIGAGALLELAEFHLIPYRVWDLWPVAIIAVGLLMLWRSLQPREYSADPQDIRQDGSAYKRVFNGPAPEHLSIFGGGERRISDANFTRADILALFGGYKLDLRKASMKGSTGVVEATALFGGIEIVVPENWNVVVRGVGIFGGYGDETTHHSYDGSQAPELIVEGVAIFGGVAIKN